jgi:hypothetical protein
MTSQVVKATADSGRFTLGDLRGFLSLADAAGLPDAAPVKARVSPGGLRSVEAGEPRDGQK